MKEKGFKGTFIWRPQGVDYGSDYLRQNIAAIKNQGFDVYVYRIDEPFGSAKLAQS